MGQWLPPLSNEESSRSRPSNLELLAVDSDDEETKQDLEQIRKAKDERRITMREIENIQEKMSDKTTAHKRRIQTLEKSRKELQNQRRILRLQQEKIENIQKTKKRIREEASEKEREMKKLTLRLMEQHQEMQMENKAFQRMLDKQGLIT